VISPIILSIAMGIAVLMFFGGLAQFMGSRAEVIGSRLDRYATREGVVQPTQEGDSKRPGRFAQMLNRMLERRVAGPALAVELARADLKITTSEYILINIATVLLTFLLGLVLFRVLVLALIFSIGGYFLPRLYVRWRQQRRLNAFNDQLGDAITLLANSLRAGYSLMQSIEVISRELSPPISIEFERVVREVGLGLTNEEALNNMLRRINSEDLDMMITAVLVQSEVGGNLAEILDIIGETIRERVRIQGEIRVLTSQQMLSGYIITLLPVILAAVLFVIDKEYMSLLYTTTCGWTMLTVAIVMITIGFFIIRKIVNIEV